MLPRSVTILFSPRDIRENGPQLKDKKRPRGEGRQFKRYELVPPTHFELLPQGVTRTPGTTRSTLARTPRPTQSDTNSGVPRRHSRETTRGMESDKRAPPAPEGNETPPPVQSHTSQPTDYTSYDSDTRIKISESPRAESDRRGVRTRREQIGRCARKCPRAMARQGRRRGRERQELARSPEHKRR